MASGVPSLTQGAVQDILNGVQNRPMVMQILQLKKLPDNSASCQYRTQIYDGVQVWQSCIMSPVNNGLIESGLIDPKCIIRACDYYTTDVSGRLIIVLGEVDVLMSGSEVTRRGGLPQNEALKSNRARETNVTTNSTEQPIAAPPTSSSSSKSVARTTSQVQAIPHMFPIVSLSPYQNKWCIRARVTLKSPIKTWSNKRGEGKLFSVDLADESGEIRATAFNAECDRFFYMIEPKKIYLIHGGTIKVANKQFTSVDNDYELTFTSDTQIEPCFDESACNLPEVTFNSTKFNDLSDASRDRLIDAMGIVIQIGELETKIARASNRELKKRDVRLVDDSGVSVNLTLWDDKGQNFDAEQGSLVLIKGCRIHEFGGGISLSSTSTTQIYVNPDLPEAHAIRGWFDSNPSLENAINISTLRGSGPIDEARQTIPLMVGELRSANAAEKGEYFSVKAEVLSVFKDNPLYAACPDCNKKVIEQNSGFYRCEKCNKELPNYTWRLLLNLRIGDFSSSCTITAFQDVAEKMLGVSAQKLANDREEHQSLFDQYFDRLHFKSFVFRIRSKQEMYNDESRLRYTAVAVDEVNCINYTKNLLDSVKRLAAMPMPY